MMLLPGLVHGTFNSAKAYTMYNCAGDPLTDERPDLVPERTISLNAVAAGEALESSALRDKDAQWPFAAVVKDGSQHVYVATPKEAANAKGNARIEGLKSLATWLGTLRKPHKKTCVVPDCLPDCLSRPRAWSLEQGEGTAR